MHCCGICVRECSKGNLSVGSVGTIVRGLHGMDFLEIMVEDWLICGICARVCPTGALELRQEGKTLNDVYTSKPWNRWCRMKTVSTTDFVRYLPKSMYWGDSGYFKGRKPEAIGKTLIDSVCCAHCGWCAALCPMNAISVEKSFEGDLIWADNVC